VHGLAQKTEPVKGDPTPPAFIRVRQPNASGGPGLTGLELEHPVMHAVWAPAAVEVAQEAALFSIDADAVPGVDHVAVKVGLEALSQLLTPPWSDAFKRRVAAQRPWL